MKRLLFGVGAAVSLCACSDDAGRAKSVFPFAAAARESQAIGDEFVGLVPRDSAGILHAPAPGKLRAEVERIVKAVAPGFEKLTDVLPLVSSFGLRPRDLDLDKSGTVILQSVPGGAGFLPMWVLPMQDAKEAADLVEANTEIVGSHIAIGALQKSGESRKPHPLAEAFPSGDLAVRLQLLKLLAPFRGMIRQYLDPAFLAARQPQGRKLSSAQMRQMTIMTDGLKGLLGTARRLDIGLKANGGSVDLDCVLEVGAGTSWDQGTARADGELAHFARALALPDASLVVLTTPVWSKWMDSFRGVYQEMVRQMAPEQGQAFAAMLNRVKAIYDTLRVGVVAGVQFTPEGAQGAVLLGCESPRALVEVFGEASDDLDPAAKDSTATSEVDGVTMIRRTFDTKTIQPGQLLPKGLPIDPKVWTAALGTGKRDIAVGILDQKVGFFCGAIDTTAKATFAAVRSKTAQPGKLLAQILPKLHAAPELLIACDVRQTLRDLRAALPKEARQSLPDVPTGDPVLVWAALSSGGTRYELQLHADIVPLMAMFR